MRCADAETDATEAAVPLTSRNLTAAVAVEVTMEAVADTFLIRRATAETLTDAEATALASAMFPSSPKTLTP